MTPSKIANFAAQAFLRGQLALLLLNDLFGPGKFKGRRLVVARKAASQKQVLAILPADFFPRLPEHYLDVGASRQSSVERAF
jgi:hypothetical protein